MKYCILVLTAIVVFISCTKSSSPTTGWDYNNPSNGGFQKVAFLEQETGPGLVLIEGGTFEMFLEQDSVLTEKKMEVVIPSFYMDEKEVSNFAWCEYLYWLSRTYGADYPLVVMNALPDTLVWEGETGAAGNYINNYLRHPAYQNYPVVGLNWMQANNYCEWRTDRVNESILIREGIFAHYPHQINEDNFNTLAYLAGQYMSGAVRNLEDLNPYREERQVRLEDGILLPQYRLPTESEWEYAASAGVTIDKKTQGKLDQTMTRFGRFVNPLYNDESNFNTLSVVPVDAYLPNDFGLYNMSGNVSEWVADTYIQRTDTSINSYSPFAGGRTQVPVESLYYKYDEKLNIVIYDLPLLRSFMTTLEVQYLSDNPNDSLAITVFDKFDTLMLEAEEYEVKGNYLDAALVMQEASHDLFDELQMVAETWSPNGFRFEYQLLVSIKKCMARSILDIPGHVRFQDVSPYNRIKYRNNASANYPFYDSIVSFNNLRVFKGANWKDTEKWVTPSFRRSNDKFYGSAVIGFRCAMDRVGSPVGLGKKKKK